MLTQEEYQKLALQQYVHYQTQMDEYLALEEELEELRAKISARHKKHRRCDKEIHKSYKVKIYLFSVEIVKKVMLQTQP